RGSATETALSGEAVPLRRLHGGSAEGGGPRQSPLASLDRLQFPDRAHCGYLVRDEQLSPNLHQYSAAAAAHGESPLPPAGVSHSSAPQPEWPLESKVNLVHVLATLASLGNAVIANKVRPTSRDTAAADDDACAQEFGPIVVLSLCTYTSS